MGAWINNPGKSHSMNLQYVLLNLVFSVSVFSRPIDLHLQLANLPEDDYIYNAMNRNR